MTGNNIWQCHRKLDVIRPHLLPLLWQWNKHYITIYEGKRLMQQPLFHLAAPYREVLRNSCLAHYCSLLSNSLSSSLFIICVGIKLKPGSLRSSAVNRAGPCMSERQLPPRRDLRRACSCGGSQGVRFNLILSFF